MLVVAEMYLKGRSMREIGLQIGVSISQVKYDLDAVRKEWREARPAEYSALVDEQLAKIDRLEREAWDAWESSKGVQETTIVATEGTVGDGQQLPRKATIRREQAHGNPAHWENAFRCVDRRCKLLGLDAPTRAEHSGPGGKPIEVRLVHEMTDDELAAIVAKEVTDAQRAA